MEAPWYISGSMSVLVSSAELVIKKQQQQKHLYHARTIPNDSRT